MTEEYIRISELIGRDKLGTLTPEEKCELDNWLKADDLHRHIYAGISIDKDTLLRDETGRVEAEQWAWTRIEGVVKRRRIRMRYGWSAACMLLLCGVALLFVGRNRSVPELSLVNNVSEIVPGQQKAVLQLSDGRKVILSDTSLTLSFSGGCIRKTDEGLVYRADTFQEKELLNILTVPRGGEYRVLLADGTKVWLNSDSRLVYPEVFTGDVRRVELQGEAYFEVTKNAGKPFIVDVCGVDVRVLGTAFNIKSYHEEKQMLTTLTEGSVMLTTDTHNAILKPNQQGVIVAGEKQISVRDVDAVDYSAWRAGKFVFRRERLDAIMQAVARWYNVEVFYRNPEVKELIFSGKMDRYEQVGELLGMLQKTGKVAFELKDKVIIVSSK